MIILDSLSVPSCSSLCGILSSMSMAHCTVACEKAMSASSSSFIICSTSFDFCLADFAVLTERDGFGAISATVGVTSAIVSCCGSMATGVGISFVWAMTSDGLLVSSWRMSNNPAPKMKTITAAAALHFSIVRLCDASGFCLYCLMLRNMTEMFRHSAGMSRWVLK